MAMGKTSRPPLIVKTIEKSTTSAATNYTEQIREILTEAAPQSWDVGLYGGSIRASSGSSYAAWAGYYNIFVSTKNVNYATQGFAVVQGRIFSIWYTAGAWSVAQIGGS